MRRLVFLTLACCGPSSPAGDDDGVPDGDVPGCAGSDFANPVALTGVIDNANDPSTSGDPLALWFSRTGIVPTYDISGATRATATGSFDTQVDFPHNSSASDRDPALTADGLVMVFISDRDGTLKPYESRRTSTSAAFAAPTEIPLGPADNGIDVSGDGLTLYFVDAAGELRSASRASRTTAFDRPTEALAAGLQSPTVSADELELYYSRNDAVGVYRRTRASKAEPFDKNEKLVLAEASEPDVSPDSTKLYVNLNGFAMLTRACD